MPLFEYRGRAGHNKELVKGRLEAAGIEHVASHLARVNVIPIDISPVKYDWQANIVDMIKSPFRKKVKLEDLAFFCRQMYTLLKAGVPIMQALHGLMSTTPNKLLADTLAAVRDSLDAGMGLTTSFRHHPDVFSGLFIGLIQAGENTGNLAGSFQQLAEYLDKEREFKQKIGAALRYPYMVIIAMVIAMTILNVFVIPAFAAAYKKLGADLPLPTRFLIATSNFTIHYWYVLLLLVIAGIVGIKVALGTTQGRFLWHQAKLRLPVIGDILLHATLGRFASTLAIAIRTGLPWSEALGLAGETVENDHIRRHVLLMRTGVENGQSITTTAVRSGLFPPLVLQMFRVGEQAGEMENMLQEVADYYESESNYKLATLSSAIEPILIVVLGLMVLILALGIFLPMWDIGRAAIHK